MTDSSRDFSRLTQSRNWLVLAAIPVAGDLILKSLNLVSIGLFNAWFTSLLLLFLLGFAASITARLMTFKRTAISAGPESSRQQPERDETSHLSERQSPDLKWATLQREFVGYLWFLIGIGSFVWFKIATGYYEDLAITLNPVTRFLLNPYATHLFVGIGFVVLIAVNLMSNEKSRLNVQVASLIAMTACTAIVFMGFIHPLIKLLETLG
ncbi:MAG: hypothetical protein KDA78_14025 [Planctomycetaceae bacterium]|nr:hypothetical protein [Planctomycetaceae bacterium]